jgi:DNA-binding IclR family transcriptional regulator
MAAMTPPSRSTSRPSSEAENGRGQSVLQNGFAVLRCFTVDEPLQGVSEIAAKVDLHKSTVSRILATLEGEGLIERDPDSRRFRLGMGVIALAGPLLANLDVRRLAFPVLVDLSRRTSETAALMTWDGGDAVCVEQVPSRHQVKHTTPLGTRYHDAASSSVQAFLAHLDETSVSDLLDRGTVTATPDEADRLPARLAEVRERGYALNYGDTSGEEVGVAVPVHDHRGQVTAAVLVSAPRFRISTEQAAGIAEAAREAAAALTGRLGGTSTPPPEETPLP